MPRVRKKIKKRESGYNTNHLYFLRKGHDFGDGFGDEFPDHSGKKVNMEEVRKAWEIFREEILKDWICEEPGPYDLGPGPGTRPWAWWKFDAPELLRRIDGKPHPFDNPERIAEIAKREAKYPGFAESANETFYGRPGIYFMPDDFEAVYETQLDLLKRHNLLMPGELD